MVWSRNVGGNGKDSFENWIPKLVRFGVEGLVEFTHSVNEFFMVAAPFIEDFSKRMLVRPMKSVRISSRIIGSGEIDSGLCSQ